MRRFMLSLLLLAAPSLVHAQSFQFQYKWGHIWKINFKASS